MKYTLLFLGSLHCIVAFATAQELPPKAPPELAALKRRYDDDISAATRTIRERYATSLQSLLRSTTQRGDLVGALAIQNELNAHSEKLGAPNAPANLLGTWRFRFGKWSETRTFRANGTVIHNDTGKVFQWQANDKQVIIPYSDGPLVFDLPMDSAGTKGREKSGREIIATKE